MFLALHHLFVPTVAVREGGRIDDVVEGVNGQIEQLQVGHGHPRAPNRHRRLQS